MFENFGVTCAKLIGAVNWHGAKEYGNGMGLIAPNCSFLLTESTNH